MSQYDLLDKGSILVGRPRSRSRSRPLLGRGRISLVIFLLPSMLIIFLFKLVPTMVTLLGSFFRQDEVRGLAFTWLTNFRSILSDPIFWKASSNIVLFATWYIGLSLFLGFALALLFNSKLGRSGLLIALSVLPILLSPAAVSWIFKMLLNPRGGALIELLDSLPFVPRVDFLNNPRWGVAVMLAITLWNTTGLFIIIFLAGLKTIDKGLYEASVLDGASLWGQLHHLILPHLRLLFLLAGLVGLMISYQLFDPVLVLRTGGFSTDALGPGSSRAVPVYLIFRAAFRSFRQGNWPFWSGGGSAMTLLFLVQFGFVVALGGGIFKFLRREGR